jgi:Ca-activated chloride channel family protein
MNHTLQVAAWLAVAITFQACESQRTGGSNYAKGDSAVKVEDLQAQKVDEAKISNVEMVGVEDYAVVQMAPPPGASHKFTAPVIMSDEQNKVKQIDFETEDYDRIEDNPFYSVTSRPLSTFSIDVDRAAYSNVRRFINDGMMPPKGAVRIEEMVNYFHYAYPQPVGDQPFSINTELGASPWNPQNYLLHIGLQGREVPVENLPATNLVFLLDVSGSMEDDNKLPLVKESLLLLADKLRPQDQVAIVVYAGNAGLVLPGTPGNKKERINQALENLQAGGSTAGGEGIQLAYKVARENFLKNGNNRVILCTDGDFNVGPSSDDELVEMIERERKSGVFLTVLGFGMGNYKDNKMQQLADKGNGNHGYIDNISEARKTLLEEFGGTLFTIAKDVKLQMEFNPATVQAYRLIGYENRLLNDEDFNDDTKDAGEIGSGHTVTALYEIVPVGVKSDLVRKTDELKYSKPTSGAAGNTSDLVTIKFRYKKPDEEASRLLTHVVPAQPASVDGLSDNFRFSAAVAQFGMLLRESPYRQQSSFQSVLNLANKGRGNDEGGYRSEFISLVHKAHHLKPREVAAK